jgi:anti-anti-sigma factor
LAVVTTRDRVGVVRGGEYEMQPGKILVADHGGSYIIKLIGDVRLTLCTALDDFYEEMFGAADFASVMVDLSEAENIDSTTLGMLAKLALKAKERYQFVPVILSTNPDINRVLESMSFDRVFRIRHEPLEDESDLIELPQVADSEEKVRDRVLEAHRILMGLSNTNHAKFRELVGLLEQKGRGTPY